MANRSTRALKRLPASCLAAILVAATGSARAASEAVIYSFKGGSDGSTPLAGLINASGALFGTTYAGGGSSTCPSGCGTVFRVTKRGAEKVVFSFNGSGDAANPDSGLINVGGTLYGTASSGLGALFSVTPAGAENIVYSFQGGNDGSSPYAGLTKVGGTLYGTTGAGGVGGNGTVFAVNQRTGAERVVYSFKGGVDGAFPYAELISVGGILYGTTEGGGARGYGTVFALNPKTGAETVVYSFQGGIDGAFPFAGLTNVGGTFYGTTASGGIPNCGIHGTPGCGTVFAVTPAGDEMVVYSFVGFKDGAGPFAGLLNVAGTLFGTTSAGGGDSNLGTVFSVTTSGTETVLYSFKGGSDGAYPFAGLVSVGGVLYGTTQSGGAGDYGTVFAVTP